MLAMREGVFCLESRIEQYLHQTSIQLPSSSGLITGSLQLTDRGSRFCVEAANLHDARQR